MIRVKSTIKEWAFVFLCFYACCYPIFAQLLLTQDSLNVGSSALQFFQGATAIALLFFLKVRSPLRVSNLWFLGALYFTFIAFYMAIFRAFDEKTVEITYALRFILWFLFAFALDHNCFSVERIRTLVAWFWLGGLIQCCLAIVCYLFHLGGGSIYSDVESSVGSQYVSGKTIVSFVSLEIILSLYWFLRSKKSRVFYLLASIIGGLVILFSFNRTAQLGLFVAALWSLTWLVRHNRVKLLFAAFLTVVVVAVFLAVFNEGAFLKRWGQVERDQGSGRVEILNTAIRNLEAPKSAEAFLIGRGYHKTKNLMHEVFGVRIGAHSDLLDFATSYGFVGLLFYIAVILKFFSYSKKIRAGSLERLCCRASTIAFVVMSLVTGVFQGTYAVLTFLFFTYYYRDKEGLRRLKGIVQSRPSTSAPLFLNQENSTSTGQDVSEPEAFSERNDNLSIPTDDVEELSLVPSTPSQNSSERLVENETPNETKSNEELGGNGEDKNVCESEEDLDVNFSKYDERTLCWLNGLDSLYGDVDEINKIFVQKKEQTDALQ